MRFYQSKPFFFSEQDNSAVQVWTRSLVYPQGSTIQATIGGIQCAVVALNAGTSGSSAPVFPITIFTPPFSQGAVLFVLPAPGTPGTVIDNSGPNQIMWATVGLWTSTLWTQLSTVYSVNQYTMPFGYISPDRLEITTANLRRGSGNGFEWCAYNVLRDYDVVQPSPITAYPTLWSWYQQQLYLWPYPNGFFPLTVSFRYGPPVLTQPNQSNFWTTVAEPMIRAEAAARMALALIHDPDAAEHYKVLAKLEEAKLRSQAIQQRSPSSSGIPASTW